MKREHSVFKGGGQLQSETLDVVHLVVSPVGLQVPAILACVVTIWLYFGMKKTQTTQSSEPSFAEATRGIPAISWVVYPFAEFGSSFSMCCTCTGVVSERVSSIGCAQHTLSHRSGCLKLLCKHAISAVKTFKPKAAMKLS